jgi:hypothetical protein
MDWSFVLVSAAFGVAIILFMYFFSGALYDNGR